MAEILAACKLYSLPRGLWPEFLDWMRVLDLEFLAFCDNTRQKGGA